MSVLGISTDSVQNESAESALENAEIPAMSAKVLDGEEWRPAYKFPNYEVSSMGRVRNAKTGRLVKPRQNHNGYLRYGLYNLGTQCQCYAAAMVLEAFVCPRPDGLFTLHGNGVRTDNRLENLRWGTRRENTEDALRHGRILRGEKHPSAKLTPDKVRQIRKIRSLGLMNRCAIGRQFNITPQSVDAVVSGKAWASVK